MLSGRMRVAQDHLYARVSEHRCKSNQVDPGHGSASRPSMTKIVESKVLESDSRLLPICAVDSRQRADVRTIYFDDWLIGRSTRKNKIPFHFLKPSSQDRTSPLAERDFASGCFCLSKWVEAR